MLPYLEHVLYRALPIALRVGGLLSFAPFLGSLSISLRVKTVLLLAITAALYPVCPVPALYLSPWAWMRIALAEATLGLALGLCLQFAFEAVQLGGALAGFQFSFSLVNIIDPQTNVDTPVLSTFYQLVALLLFLQMNVHHWLLRGLAKSFEYVPIGSVVIQAATMKELFRDAAGMWLVGVQIAAPVLLATLLLDLTIGFVTKAAPQMPAIFLSIPLKSVIGYAVLAIGVGLWPGLLEKQFASALGWGERVLRLAH
ncbi:MAG TPA: flagellar biosynthetic protein FliR [Candidatus Acidoferrales bacterium]|nr:flagellar biosynthetic protein FliR [Candidatus Acidoferrales bacterium]